MSVFWTSPSFFGRSCVFFGRVCQFSVWVFRFLAQIILEIRIVIKLSYMSKDQRALCACVKTEFFSGGWIIFSRHYFI